MYLALFGNIVIFESILLYLIQDISTARNGNIHSFQWFHRSALEPKFIKLSTHSTKAWRGHEFESINEQSIEYNNICKLTIN